MSVLPFSVPTGVKKAAAVIQTSITSDGPPQLYMLNLQEKLVTEAMTNVCSAKQECAERLDHWVNEGNNVPVRECLLKISQIELMEVKLQRKQIEQYEAQRKWFKQLLDGEKSLDKIRKQLDVHKVNVQKIQKKVAEARRKKGSKFDHINTELVKAVSQMDMCTKELQQQELAHESFKYTSIHEMLTTKCQADSTLHHSLLQTNEAKKQLIQLYTNKPFLKITPDYMATAQREGTQLLAALENALGVSASELPSSDTVNQRANYPQQPAPPPPYPNSASNSPAPQRSGVDPASQRPLPPLPPDQQLSMDDQEYLTSYIDMSASESSHLTSARSSESLTSHRSQRSNTSKSALPSPEINVVSSNENPDTVGEEYVALYEPDYSVKKSAKPGHVQQNEEMKMNSLYNALPPEPPMAAPRVRPGRSQRSPPNPNQRRLAPDDGLSLSQLAPPTSSKGMAASYHDALQANPLLADQSYYHVDPNKPLVVNLPSRPQSYLTGGYIPHNAISPVSSPVTRDAQEASRDTHVSSYLPQPASRDAQGMSNENQYAADDVDLYADIDTVKEENRRQTTRRSFTGQLDTYDVA